MTSPLLRRIAQLACPYLLLLALGACGGAAPESRVEATSADAHSRSIWMPPFTAHGRHGPAESGCTPALTVELSVLGETLTGVLLSDQLEGRCATAVDPNKRFYELREVANDCGSRTYVGDLSGPEGAARVTVVDHSRRRCDDRRLGLIEVVEHGSDAVPRGFAGDWQK